MGEADSSVRNLVQCTNVEHRKAEQHACTGPVLLNHNFVAIVTFDSSHTSLKALSSYRWLR